MPKLNITEQQVRETAALLYAIATEREGFMFSADGRQQMQSTAHNLDWLLRQADFRSSLAHEDPELCPTCRVEGHDACAGDPSCRCCVDTMTREADTTT